MVLLVGGRTVPPCLSHNALLAHLIALPELRQAAEAFLDSPVSLPPGVPAVHVFQGEAAVVGTRLQRHPAQPPPAAQQQQQQACHSHRQNPPPLCYLGSTDATTCVIAALLDTGAGLAAVAHYDEGSAACPADLAACLPPEMEAPSLYLVGGFSEARGLGRTTAAALLSHYHAAPLPISLRLCCAAGLNTDAAGAPRCQSLALHLPSGTPLAVAHWPDRGPLTTERLAQLWLHDSGGGSARLQQVWDRERSRLVVRLQEGTCNAQLALYLRYLLRQDAPAFLRMVSTSPEYEGPGFLQGGLVGGKSLGGTWH